MCSFGSLSLFFKDFLQKILVEGQKLISRTYLVTHHVLGAQI